MKYRTTVSFDQTWDAIDETLRVEATDSVSLNAEMKVRRLEIVANGTVSFSAKLDVG